MSLGAIPDERAFIFSRARSTFSTSAAKTNRIAQGLFTISLSLVASDLLQ